MEQSEKLALEIKTYQAEHYEALKERDRIKRLHDQITTELAEKDAEIKRLSRQIDMTQEYLVQLNLS